MNDWERIQHNEKIVNAAVENVTNELKSLGDRIINAHKSNNSSNYLLEHIKNKSNHIKKGINNCEDKLNDIIEYIQYHSPDDHFLQYIVDKLQCLRGGLTSCTETSVNILMRLHKHNLQEKTQ